MWFFRDLARYQAEVDEVATLADADPNFELVEWRLGDGVSITCDVDIRVGTYVRPVSLVYGSGFPHTPPSVLPRVKERWSDHQYGAGGELCLEFGPDNWQPEMTGAAMLQSAYRLLSGEAVQDGISGPPAEVLSRHLLTRGQELRSKRFRFTYSAAFEQRSATLTGNAPATFCLRVVDEDWIAFPRSIAAPHEAEWVDSAVPAHDIVDGQSVPGFLCLDPGMPLEPLIGSARQLRQALLGVDTDPESRPRFELFTVAQASRLRVFMILSSSDAVYEFSALIPPSSGQRLAPEYEALKLLQVGLVGCGSVGSKVAAMLARAGVRRFLIVDDDVMQQENLVRNELDWTDVAFHKAAALKRRLLRIQPDAAITVRKIRLGGQEASGSLDSAVSALSKCDVILDATASPAAFNLASAAAMNGKVPLLWAEVFAGGIGGAIARSRPGLDPSPQMARARLVQWYADQAVPFPALSGDGYNTEVEGIPLVADDAEVSVMAAHLARLAIDAALARSPSAFPVSAYVIAMRAGWMFTEPFQVWPIDLGEAEPATAVEQDPQNLSRAIEGLGHLIEKLNVPPASA